MPREKFTVMQEPAFILKNGTSVPYIPGTITTSRDAYAASLHVLFKHVADFHICIIQTFSVKYGIPEDDILKTIQESEEFKNMLVDPVLDMDFNSLGYLDEASKTEAPATEAPATEAPATEAPAIEAQSNEVPPPSNEAPVVEVPKPTATKAKAKKTKTSPVADVQVPVSKELVPEEEEADAQKPQKPVAKANPVAKAKKTTKNAPVEAPVVEALVEAPVVLEESRPDPEIKTKTIRKKVVPKPVTTTAASTVATTVATTAPATTVATTAPATTAPATTAPIAPALAAIEGDVPRKIIKKRTTQTVST